jgi:hypothetical protein
MFYNIILLCGFLLALWNILKGLRNGGTGAFILNPVIWFSVFYILIHIFVAGLKYNTSGWRYDYSYDEQFVINAGLITLLGYQFGVLVLNTTSKSLVAKSLRRAEYNRNHAPREHIVWLLYAIGLATMVVGAFFFLRNYGQLTDDYLTDRIGAGLGRGLSRSMPNFLISSSLIFGYIYLSLSVELRRSRLIAAVLGGISFVMVVFYYNSINSRNSIFLSLILLGSLYFFLRPAGDVFSGKFLRKALLALMLSVAAWTVFSSMTRVRYTVAESTYTLDRLDELETSMLYGAFGNDENIIWMANNEYKQHGGISYFAAVSNFVPRSMWPDKPLGGGPRMKNEIFPGSYVVGASGNSSFTTGLFAEVWLNFGPWGILYIIPIWALTGLFFVSGVARNLYTIRALPWMACAVLWSTALIYSEFAGFFGRLVFICTPLFIAGFLGTQRAKTNSAYSLAPRQRQVNLV